MIFCLVLFLRVWEFLSPGGRLLAAMSRGTDLRLRGAASCPFAVAIRQEYSLGNAAKRGLRFLCRGASASRESPKRNRPVTLSIRRIIEQVINGQLRIPTFQRGFVWEPAAVAALMDSIFKGYPIGQVLLWRTRETLSVEKQIGPFNLFDKTPDYPVDYVLDGQQRITSLFGVFQNEVEPEGETESFDIFFDLQSRDDFQETQFFAIPPADAAGHQYFPLKTLFDVTEYRRATSSLDASTAERVDKLQAIFKEYTLPLQILETEDKAKVAIVFERINRKGVPLDTLQLLTAWTWRDDFDLQNRFASLKNQLEPFGFEEVGETTNLLLRCIGAILRQDTSIDNLINTSGSEIRASFQKIENGVMGAIDFLKQNLYVQKLSNLPFETLLVPLSYYFAAAEASEIGYDSKQRQALIRWFWYACFTRRYSAGTIDKMNTDIAAFEELKTGNDEYFLGLHTSVSSEFFKENTFRVNTVNSKTFILLLVVQEPRSWISGTPISLASVLQRANRNEFHHIYPRAYLEKNPSRRLDANCLANFVCMSRADNRTLGGIAPSKYRTYMHSPANHVLEPALVPDSVFEDNFDAFVMERSQILAAKANALLG